MKQALDGIKFLLLLSTVFLVIFSSGCVTTGKERTGGPGIVIEKFEPSLSMIESGEPVSLRLEVRNVGGYNNAPVVAEIMDIDPTEWQVSGGTIRSLGTLLMPDPESNTQGQKASATWDLIAPYLKRGQELPYQARARVYYYYETIATKPVWFVTTDELRRIVRMGEALPSEPTIYTNGPLSVTIDAGQFVKAREWRESKFQLQIRIDNNGNGQVLGRNYPVGIEVKWPSWVTPVGGMCPAQTVTPLFQDVPPGLPQPTTSRYILLWNGRYADITCEFMITQPPSSRTKGNFEVKLAYDYFIDATTQITVKGTEEYM